ncbi:hypothetical protein LCGC14_0305760 [marine sediment metagenome]|uniref:Uncharacterized protein n=1 Tax=marine sediment metagenome TaxID=412755 RepID=A0A0F9U626_9ZZZZ
MDWKQTIELTDLKSPRSKVLKLLTKKANNEGYLGVCVQARDLLVIKKYAREGLKLVTIAGFPPIIMFPRIHDLIKKDFRYSFLLGHYTRAEIKRIREIAKENIADELDIIFPFSWHTMGYDKRILHFLKGVKKIFPGKVKVIIELGTIFKEEKHLKKICSLLEEAGIDIVKTNSGLIKQSFTTLLAHVIVLKKITKLPIKASGGIRSVGEAQLLIHSGVTRIGSSGLKNSQTEGENK